MPKKVKKGHLTPRQRRILEVLVSHPEYNKSRVAEDCHVTVSYISQLLTDHEDFKEALDKRLKEEWADARRNAQQQMINLSNNGDYRATAYILDANGYSVPQQIEISTNTIRVTIDDDE